MARTVYGIRANQSSNPAPSGIPNGTPGGRSGKSGVGQRVRNGLQMGDEVYLWILLFIEVAAMAFLRKHFRRYHGG